MEHWRQESFEATVAFDAVRMRCRCFLAHPHVYCIHSTQIASKTRIEPFCEWLLHRVKKFPGNFLINSEKHTKKENEWRVDCGTTASAGRGARDLPCFDGTSGALEVSTGAEYDGVGVSPARFLERPCANALLARKPWQKWSTTLLLTQTRRSRWVRPAVTGS